jgi:hypothetical protein
MADVKYWEKQVKTIKYYDLIAHSGIHSEFNVAFLQVIILAIKNYNRIDFFSEKGHCVICKDKINDQNIAFHPLFLLHKKIIGGIKTPLRDVLSYVYILKSFLFSDKTDYLFFVHIFPLAHYLVFILNKIMKRPNVYLCKHGELEVYIRKDIKNKRYYSLDRALYSVMRSHIKYIILGESIFRNIKHIFENNKNIIIIDHPYNWDNMTNKNHGENFYPLIIGQIGLGTKSKGTELLFVLANILKKYILEKKLIVMLIGRLDIKVDDNGLVKYYEKILDDKDFNEKITALHYTLHLRDKYLGKAIASASFMDSIKYEKPYFSLENDYVSYYSDQFPGCGIICSSIEDMAKKIESILHNKKNAMKDYKNNINSIKIMKNRMSLLSIAREFEKQL